MNWFLLKRKAAESLFEETRQHKMDWGLGEEKRWGFDMDLGQLTWVFPDCTIAAQAQILGTHNGSDDTWLWSWANPSIPEALTMVASKIRAFGEEHELDLLTEDSNEMNSEAPWDIVAMASYLRKGCAVYRGKTGKQSVYFCFEDVAKLPEDG